MGHSDAKQFFLYIGTMFGLAIAGLLEIDAAERGNGPRVTCPWAVFKARIKVVLNIVMGGIMGMTVPFVAWNAGRGLLYLM